MQDIKYALMRMKVGNPDKSHISLVEAFMPKIEELGLSLETFNNEWSVDRTTGEIISGVHLKRFKATLESALPATNQATGKKKSK